MACIPQGTDQTHRRPAPAQAGGRTLITPLEYVMNEQEFIEKYAERVAGFRVDTFQPLLNDTFIYRDASGVPHELRLSQVEAGKSIGDLFESFTLVFRSAREVSFQQGHYLLEHKEHGDFPLFLVPSATLEPGQNCCCAYFSVRKNPAR
jgi:hypothetical protein